ncbi:hypothetical protein [Aquipuribacter hungaricus]|uniref:hypothetical protein n=1 Tax=Aquipuribacter hungaricus TaxID=545624 RepID=UPI0030EB2FEF
MTQPAVTRRPRGSGHGRVALFTEVDAGTKAIVDHVSSVTGAPKWAVVEAMVLHTPLGDDGLPVWWESLMHQEELPLPRSA